MNEIVREFTEDDIVPNLPALADGSALKAFTTQDKDGNPIGVVSIVTNIDARIASFGERGYTVDTKEGRDKIRSFAHVLGKCKVKVRDHGKALADEQKAIPTKIDKARRFLEAQLEMRQAAVRQPLTDWEAVEEQRITKHQTALGAIQSATDVEDMTAVQIEAQLIAIQAIELTRTNCEEFLDEYAIAVTDTITTLRKLLAKRKQDEQDAADLARLRAAEAEREKEAEAERLRKEGEEKAKLEAEADARAEKERADAKIANERAKALEEKQKREEVERENERLKKEAEDKAIAAAAAEREKIEREKAEAAEVQRKREANTRHVGNVRRAAKEALMQVCGLDEEQAKRVVLAINGEQIPNVIISY